MPTMRIVKVFESFLSYDEALAFADTFPIAEMYFDESIALWIVEARG